MGDLTAAAGPSRFVRLADRHWTADVLESATQLPDGGDLHVVAAAVRGGAQGIITASAKDFPAASRGSLGLEAIHPDDFLLGQPRPAGNNAIARTRPGLTGEENRMRRQR